MHIGDSPDEAAFRAEARRWLEEHAEPRSATAVSDPHADLAEHVKRCRTWQATLYEHGWAGITWPTAFGGRGQSAIHAAIFNEEQARFDVATGSFTVALGMVGPTLMAHGTPEQQEAFLPAMLRGDHLWCQLFSEPGAGSDLASLGTRAVRDGDEWVVNGQKVWTSLGQFAEYGILLARTDPDVPKHAGISYFVVDMRSPGVDVRPLRQMTGVAHFNEVFLSDVRLPADAMVGAEGEGWKVAATTLTSERAAIGGGQGTWSIEDVVELAQRTGASRDPVLRQELMQAWCRAATLRYLGYRLRTAMSQRRMPGPEMLIMKLAMARHWAATADTVLEMLGADALLGGPEAIGDGRWQQLFLSQYAVRLGGGTDEVQQNIIGERGLGLPREPSVDKDVPWRALARG
jgi:alkylation response protein AidB-like acyl-CoA dehydrogenase